MVKVLWLYIQSKENHAFMRMIRNVSEKKQRNFGNVTNHISDVTEGFLLFSMPDDIL